ncbi:MAG: hypothetical protein WD739_11550 [Actinomycetota bacterium]
MFRMKSSPTVSTARSFRVALVSNHDLESLVVVNPSVGDSEEIRSIFGPILSRLRPVVRQFKKLRYLTEHLPDALS